MIKRINLKKKQLKCGHFDYVFSKGRCKFCAMKSYKSTERLSKEKHKRNFNSVSIKKLEKDLVIIHSLYVRLKNANKYGILNCFVCNKPIHYTKAHNSHYIDRLHRATRYLDENCHESCPSCNAIHNENKEPYKQALERWRKGTVEFLEKLKHKTYKFTRNELEQLIIEYKNKVEIYKSKLV